MNQGVQDQIM